MSKSRTHLVLGFLTGAAMMFLVACGDYPTPLRSARDIARTPATTEALSVRELGVEHFPALGKFRMLKHLKFFHPDGTGASDEKLEALGRLSLPRLNDVNLANCPSVTDRGVLALTNLASISLLHLEGTSITDTSLQVLARSLRLTGINVAKCRGVTVTGLQALCAMDTLEELTFSVENMSEAEVLDLVERMKAVKWCTIVDPTGKLQPDPVLRAAAAKGTNISIVRQATSENTMNSN